MSSPGARALNEVGEWGQGVHSQAPVGRGMGTGKEDEEEKTKTEVEETLTSSGGSETKGEVDFHSREEGVNKDT